MNTLNIMTKDNEKYVDLLDEDRPLAGQKFVCISFISPENIIKQKEMFYFQEFMKDFDFTKSMSKFHQFLNFVSYKYSIDFNKVNEDFNDFVKEEKEYLIKNNIEDEYKNFLDRKEDDLLKEYNEKYNFQTNVRGLKVRGVFETIQEAEMRCKLLREIDPNHDIYVGQVGIWMPWHPESYKTGHVEYMEKELNNLMREKMKNEEQAKAQFEERIKETRKKAIEENIKIARETGNKLTQNIDENGNLVGITNTNTILDSLESSVGKQNVTSADIKKELFEGENILTKKK